MTITDDYDAAADFAGPELYAGDPDPADLGQWDPADAPAPAPAPDPEAERRKPGPAPNPNSARQRKLAKKAAPAKKRAPNARASSAAPAPAPAPAPAQDSVYVSGARTILGWIAQPLAMAGLATQLAAQAMPTRDGAPTRKAVQTARLGEALALDSLTIAVHGEPLAQGVASMADNVPWMAQALEKAARVGPYAALTQAGLSIVLQGLCNHGILPASRMLGTLTPAELRAAAGIDDGVLTE